MYISQLRPLFGFASRSFLLRHSLVVTSLPSNFSFQHKYSNKPLRTPDKIKVKPEPLNNNEKVFEKLEDELKKLGMVQRYKRMFLEYWYVLLPVAGVTSIVFFGTFYILAKSGIDINPIINFLEKIGLPEKMLKPLKSGKLGDLAVAFVLYKFSAPARYLIVVYVSIKLIKTLVRKGLIKPMPSKEKIKLMIQEQMKKERSSK